MTQQQDTRDLVAPDAERALRAYETRSSATKLAPDRFALAGDFIEMGELAIKEPQVGLRILLADGREVTVTGLTREEVRACSKWFMLRVSLAVEAA